MIVCSCHAVTDSELREAVRCKLRGQKVDCPAASGCGCCAPNVERVEREERDRLDASRTIAEV